MTSTADAQIMTGNSIKKSLFLALQYPIAPEKEMMDHIGEHLSYMQEHEEKVFLSGPLVLDGVTIDAGLTIFKTNNEAEARALMDAEPLIKAGLRPYELKLWRIQEGSMTVGISGVNGSAVLG